ncbi:family 16 glycosylhydrolase [Ferruginibacter lapsinanis]|uniref:family 16 glycosylhydrolase n=1 Tax=Ferruginibacter lapsinanis TaxID=563172 RepID=UPI001E40CE48|nr:family 16 glycosylhydrolase [Ferruginibacter lapsinanis]UEG48828.1 family 16 glycosylhydrolase [Ferruginibacter lapsinanis]
MSLFFLLPIVMMFSSCSKDKTTTPAVSAPTNLTINAVVSADNSGNVSFTASATNATTYEYDYGNGIYQIVPSGVVIYKYPASGTFTVNVTAKNSGGTVSKSLSVTVTITSSLLWSDEFNIDGAPDPSKWGYDLGAGGWGNNELEYYTNRSVNSVVQGGVLKINALKENYSGSAYTSARLLSKGKFSFKYGKVEVSAKLPAGVGTWPAIWMLGNDINTTGWPGCGEIDIMEHRGSELNKIFGTLHYPGRSGGSANGNTTMISNATTQFHKYTLEWSETAIKIYVDDLLYHTVANSSAIPFNHDFFLILNVAMGGNFAGAVDPAFTNATMEIDYVRVYQ